MCGVCLYGRPAGIGDVRRQSGDEPRHRRLPGELLQRLTSHRAGDGRRRSRRALHPLLRARVALRQAAAGAVELKLLVGKSRSFWRK